MRADKEAFTDDGQTPLHHAAREDEHLVTRVLLEEGARPDLTRSGSLTPLQYAAAFGFTDTVRELLNCGADAAGLVQLQEWGIEIPAEKLSWRKYAYKRVEAQIEELERKRRLELGLGISSDDNSG